MAERNVIHNLRMFGQSQAQIAPGQMLSPHSGLSKSVSLSTY
jgi:hypothetical protein